MPPTSPKSATRLVLICGDDEFSVKRRSREAFEQWRVGSGELNCEIIDASAPNSAEALKAVARLREALQTLPFFGETKVVWFQNCNFLGDERVASAQALTENLAELAQELKDFAWNDVRLLISAGKVDKRKTFYKTIEKVGSIEHLASWSIDNRDWPDHAETWARQEFRALNKKVSEEALAEFLARIGPNARQLSNEAEKLASFVGKRTEVELADVNAVVTRNKHAKAFALGDALGDRDLARVLRTLDEELWAMRSDNQKSEIGLLYGLIVKVRVLLFLKEMLREGWIKPDQDYNRFKAWLGKVPPDLLPTDRRFNPLALHPYLLFKALPQAGRYKTTELVQGMELLLQCNQRLVLSGLDGSIVLQQTLLQIVKGSSER